MNYTFLNKFVQWLSYIGNEIFYKDDSLKRFEILMNASFGNVHTFAQIPVWHVPIARLYYTVSTDFKSGVRTSLLLLANCRDIEYIAFSLKPTF